MRGYNNGIRGPDGPDYKMIRVLSIRNHYHEGYKGIIERSKK